jgi:cation:H+ antiporter
MSTALRAVVFVAGVAVSLGASWVLVQRLERVGQRFGFSEALLGLVAALAADAPEVTAAVTALLNHDQRIGAGVVLGSNAFNLAALLGLSALLAGQIALHRRVVLMNGAVAAWTALVCLLAVAGVLPALTALALELVVFVPYAVLLGAGTSRLGRVMALAGLASWLAQAIGEEEVELGDAIHPSRGGPRDGLIAVAALAVVVAASIAMENEGASLGQQWSIAPIVVGGLVLAAVTSLPNAVAGIYLAAHGRGAATLSTALNSNLLNALAGLLIPASILGLGAPSTQTSIVVIAYAGLTALALASAHADHGLRRTSGAALIAAYGVFVAVLLART